MTVYKEFRVGGGGSNPFGFLGPVLILALIFVGLYFIAKGIFAVLAWAAPVLLIITLFLDYTVFTDFFKFIVRLLKDNTLLAILLILASFFGFPILAGYLFFKAVMRRSLKSAVKKAQREQQTYTEYEEVNDQADDDQFLELPPLHKDVRTKESKRDTNDYEDLFK